MFIMHLFNYCQIKPAVNQSKLQKYQKTPAQIYIALGSQRVNCYFQIMNAELLKLNFEAIFIHLESKEIQKLDNLPY